MEQLYFKFMEPIRYGEFCEIVGGPYDGKRVRVYGSTHSLLIKKSKTYGYLAGDNPRIEKYNANFEELSDLKGGELHPIGMCPSGWPRSQW